MNIKRILAVLFAIGCVSSTVLAQIQPGRAIQITVSGVPADEKARFDPIYPVSESGTINMPFIGQVRAAGLRGDQLAAALESRYKSAGIYTHPTFQVIDSSSKKIEEQVVILGGQVRAPGPKPYNRTLTLWQAIQSAGGPTEFGSMRRVVLLRKGNSKTYDVTKTQFQQIPLEPDDTIDVPQKTILNQ
jgi:protein involved in polysaccharide export with SLBB domain